jgi:ADP-ribosylglycohydrolase
LGAPAGIGRATLRAILRLWIGFTPDRSGVRSAGNGAAMRAPILGVCLAHDRDGLLAFTQASTRLTHRDPRAEQGALAVALAAAFAAERPIGELDGLAALAFVRAHVQEAELAAALHEAAEHLARGDTLRQFADALGLQRGVTGYVVHTVPVALYAWLQSSGDYRRAVEGVIRLGGDTDTTAAIVGGLVGATQGASAIPPEWLEGLCEWPRTAGWIRRLGERLAHGWGNPEISTLPLFWPGLVPRNAMFLLLVLLHGLRRLLPPYRRRSSFLRVARR